MPEAPDRTVRPTLLVLFGGVLLGALDIAIVGPALPAIQQQFGLDASQAAAVFSVYILFSLISAPLLASLSDRLGRRRVYIACLGLFGLGSLLVASSGAFWLLLAGRAVQAIGAGGTLPVATAVIADTFPPDRRGRALGLLGAVFGLAFILGPVIGGVLLAFSWRWLFLVNLPLVIVLMLASARLLADHAQPAVRQFDLRGSVLLALGLAALAFGAARLQAGPGGLPLPGAAALAAFGISLLAFTAFWANERRAAAPIFEPRLLQSRQLRIVGLLAVATGLVEASMVFLPTLAVRALDVSASAASFMLLPLVLALIAGSIIAGRLVDRLGTAAVIRAGMACTIAGLMLFALLPLSVRNFYLAGLAVGLGLASLLGAPLRLAALEEAGEGGRGASQGLLTVCLSTGRLFGASLTGGIAASTGMALTGYRRAMLMIAVACGLSLVASVGLRRRAAQRA